MCFPPFWNKVSNLEKIVGNVATLLELVPLEVEWGLSHARKAIFWYGMMAML